MPYTDSYLTFAFQQVRSGDVFVGGVPQYEIILETLSN